MSLLSQQPKMLTDFTIDAAHELALFIWNVDKNLVLKSVPYFCSRYGLECAIYAKEENVFCVSNKFQKKMYKDIATNNNCDKLLCLILSRATPLVLIKFYLLLKLAESIIKNGCHLYKKHGHVLQFT